MQSTEFPDFPLELSGDGAPGVGVVRKRGKGAGGADTQAEGSCGGQRFPGRPCVVGPLNVAGYYGDVRAGDEHADAGFEMVHGSIA